jgi:hypothetical protein
MVSDLKQHMETGPKFEIWASQVSNRSDTHLTIMFDIQNLDTQQKLVKSNTG